MGLLNMKGIPPQEPFLQPYGTKNLESRQVSEVSLNKEQTT